MAPPRSTQIRRSRARSRCSTAPGSRSLPIERPIPRARTHASSCGGTFPVEVAAGRRSCRFADLPFVVRVTAAMGRRDSSVQEDQVANRIVHAEVVGKDGPALHSFYGKLFDWQQNTDLPGGYAMTEASDSGVVLGTGPAPDGSGGWVTFYVSVDDIDATLARVTSLGGKVVMPKFSPAPDTTLAMVADPEGHVVGISQAA